MRGILKSSLLKVSMLLLAVFALACPVMAQTVSQDIVVMPPHQIVLGSPQSGAYLKQSGASTATLTGNLTVSGNLVAGGCVPTGGLTVPYGGTGLITLTSNTIYKGNGTSALAVSSLTDNGTTLATTDLLTVTGSSSLTTISSSIRQIIGDITLTGATIAAGGNSIVGARGAVTLANGKVFSSGYLYGVQGKAIINGTSNTQSGGGIIAGIFGQLDTSGGTISNTGLTAAGAFDIGGTGVAGAVTNVHGIVITNSTSTIAGSAIHIATTSSGFSSVISIDDVSNTLAKACTTVTTTGAFAFKFGNTIYWVPWSNACS